MAFTQCFFTWKMQMHNQVWIRERETKDLWLVVIKDNKASLTMAIVNSDCPSFQGYNGLIWFNPFTPEADSKNTF